MIAAIYAIKNLKPSENKKGIFAPLPTPISRTFIFFFGFINFLQSVISSVQGQNFLFFNFYNIFPKSANFFIHLIPLYMVIRKNFSPYPILLKPLLGLLIPSKSKVLIPIFFKSLIASKIEYVKE